jgi:ribonuclease HII
MLTGMLNFANVLQAYYQVKVKEAGSDEAGRGCYAGPVFAAAVILPVDFYHPLLNDSKQVPADQREMLREIIESVAISWAVASVDNDEIDSINILRASFKAMHLAIDPLKPRPKLLLHHQRRWKICLYCSRQYFSQNIPRCLYAAVA